MTTWETFLAEIRADLGDTGTTPRFSDAKLFVFTKDAVRDYSIWFPRRIDNVELALSGSSFPLPTDFIAEIQVEYPIGTFLERRANRPGTRFPNSKQSLYYFIQGGKLYTAPPNDVVYLTYLATHPVPASEEDLTFAFTIPEVDLELPRLYVKAQAYTGMRTRQAALDRFKMAGARDDNPLMPETADLMADYHEKIAQRIPGGYVSLYRPGKAV